MRDDREPACSGDRGRNSDRRPAGTKNIFLAPVPYELRLSPEIAEKLSVEAILRSWAEEVDKLGAEAMSALYYQSVEGSRSILMSA